jgi:hypothetical protein
MDPLIIIGFLLLLILGALLSINKTLLNSPAAKLHKRALEEEYRRDVLRFQYKNDDE